MALLLRRARPYGAAEPVDLLIRDGVIARVRPSGGRPSSTMETVDLDGRFVGPGLWDGHVHMTQWVVAQQRLDLAATTSAADAAALVARRLDRDQPAILVGYGFRDGLWPDEPTVALLDRVAPAAPVVLVSGDLHCAWLNSAAADRFGVTLPASGLLREGEWFEVSARLETGAAAPSVEHFAAAARAAAARGLVGIVDFEIDDNIARWPARVAAGVTSLRVDASCWPEQLDEVVRAGHRTGDRLDERGLVRVGPLKVVLDGSLNTRTAWCWHRYPGTNGRGRRTVPAPTLRRLLRTAAGHGLAVCVHAIGDRANAAALDAIEQVGLTGATIEHAQLVRTEDLLRFAALGVVASVQPEHAMDDRDVADRHWRGRTGDAFPYGALHRAGVTLRLGSDAPVAPLDPWLAIAAAVFRQRDDRAPWHPEQRLSAAVALAASAGGRLHLTEGDPADIVVVDHDPLTADPSAADSLDSKTLRELPVAGTLLGGDWTWRTL